MWPTTPASHPLFGTLADFDALLAEAHARGLKVTARFRAEPYIRPSIPGSSKVARSRDNPKRDWYIWRDSAPDGGPPNNWLSFDSAAAAWEWDAAHRPVLLCTLFLTKQPDLNWRNPAVRAAMLERAALLARSWRAMAFGSM